MTKKVRSPKDIVLRTGRFATRPNRPFLGRLNKPIPPKLVKKGNEVLDDSYLLDQIKLL